MAKRDPLEKEEEPEWQVNMQMKYFLQVFPTFSIDDEKQEVLTIREQSKAVTHLQAYELER